MASCFRLDPEMKEELDSRNQEYTKPMKAEDEVIDILSRLNMEKQNPLTHYTITDEYMTVTEFMSYHSELNKYTAEQISKVLGKLGYSTIKKKINGKVIRMKWLPNRK